MTRQLDNFEILGVVDRVVEILTTDGDPNPDLFTTLHSLPLSPNNVARLVGALAVAGAGMTLRVAGVDPDLEGARVRTIYQMPADDVPDFAKTSGELVTMGCAFLLAPPHAQDEHVAALERQTRLVVDRSPEFAILVLGELLAHMRRLVTGDTRGVVRI